MILCKSLFAFFCRATIFYRNNDKMHKKNYLPGQQQRIRQTVPNDAKEKNNRSPLWGAKKYGEKGVCVFGLFSYEQ